MCNVRIEGNYFILEHDAGDGNVTHEEYPKCDVRVGKKYDNSTDFSFYHSSGGSEVCFAQCSFADIVDIDGGNFTDQPSFESWMYANTGCGGGDPSTAAPVTIANFDDMPLGIEVSTLVLGCVRDTDGNITGKVINCKNVDEETGAVTWTKRLENTDGSVVDPYTGTWEPCSSSETADLVECPSSQLCDYTLGGDAGDTFRLIEITIDGTLYNINTLLGQNMGSSAAHIAWFTNWIATNFSGTVSITPSTGPGNRIELLTITGSSNVFTVVTTGGTISNASFKQSNCKTPKALLVKLCSELASNYGHSIVCVNGESKILLVNADKTTELIDPPTGMENCCKCNTTETSIVFNDFGSFSSNGVNTSQSSIDDVEVYFNNSLISTGIDNGSGVEDNVDGTNDNLPSWINANLGADGFAASSTQYSDPSIYSGSPSNRFMDFTYPTCEPWTLDIMNVPHSLDGTPQYFGIRYQWTGLTLVVVGLDNNRNPNGYTGSDAVNFNTNIGELPFQP